MCVCVCYVGVVYVFGCVHMCMWRSEIIVRYPSLCFTLFDFDFETRVLTESTGQQDSGIHLTPSPTPTYLS